MKTFTLDKLKAFWGIESDEVVGQYTPHNEAHGFINNLMGFDAQGQGRILLHPLNGQRLSVIAYTDKLTFEPGQYYKLTIRLKSPTITLHEKTDKVLLAIDSAKPIRSVENPYQAIVSSCFDRFDNPDANKVLASLLQEVSRGLYSSKKRMFFELLQNADDLPTGMAERPNNVHVYVEGLKSYLLIMHNGQPFNEDDVRSITSAAESTKLRENKRTGYKGIGFKSVFTDSTKKVVIKSGGFTFKFDKQAPVFRNFEELYVNNHPLYRNNSDARAYFLQRHGNSKAQYERIESVPWHLKPLWNNSPIDELVDTAFYKNHNVGIALNYGQTEVAEYLNEFSHLFADPRFLLFLRNTTRIQLTNSSTRLEAERTLISSSEKESRQETQVKLLRNTNLHSTYLIQRISIPISNEIFQSVGIDVLLQSKEVAGEVVSIFCNAKGDELPIPSKLATFGEIQLHLAAPMENGNITAETRKSFAGTSIYTYLPMKEGRIQLPMLVNADFVPSSDREKVQADNTWNHFLFYNIGYQLVDWVSRLAVSSRGEDYLNLLPHKPLNTGDTDIEPIEGWFNRGYEQGLNEIAFIATLGATEEKVLVKTNQIVVNDSELLSLSDHSFFYSFTGIDPNTRRLPEPGLDSAVLKSKYFQEKHQVQVFTEYDLITRLADPDAVAVLVRHTTQAKLAHYQKFLEHLNRLVEKYSELAAPLINTLPFLRFGNEMLAWSAIAKKDEYLLLDARTEQLRQELTALGFFLSDISIDKVPALKSALHTKNTYLDTDTILYERVSVRCAQHSLAPGQKASLFTFFKGLGGVGDTKYAQSLYLFADESGVCRPLDKLLSRAIEDPPAWLLLFRSNEAEFALLPSVAKAHLVKATNLFSQLLCDPAILAECTQALNSTHQTDWIRQLQIWRNKDAVKPSISWNDLPWLFVNDTHRYKSASQLWDHAALDSVPAQPVIESLTSWLMPHSESRPLIKQFSLLLQTDTLTNKLIPSDTLLSESDARLLLRFLVEAGENQFLTKFKFVAIEDGYQIQALGKDQRLFVADDEVRVFISESGMNDSLISFPQELVNVEICVALGALAGDALLSLLAEKSAVLSLAPLLLQRADTKLYDIYIQHLPALSLSSIATYTDQSPEVHVLRIAHDLPDRDTSQLFKSLIQKTTLDGQPLSESKDFLPTVTVKNISGKEPYRFLTAELLPNNASRIERIQNTLAAFTGSSKTLGQSFLRDKIFSSKELKADDAESEIHKSKPEYLSPVQLLFLQIHKQAKGEDISNFKTQNFYNYWVAKNEVAKAWEGIGTYLNLLYEKGFNTSYFTYGLNKCVIDSDYCLKSKESLSDFFTKWADTEDKKQFLTKLNAGAHGRESDIVKLRMALLQRDNFEAEVKMRNLDNTLLINTLKWLSEKQDDAAVTACIGSIRLIVNKIAWPDDQIPIVPIIISVKDGNKKYRLAEFANHIVHTWSESWKPYEHAVLGILVKQGAWVVENSISTELGNRIGKLNEIEPIKKLADDILEGASLLSEPCYEAWEGKVDYLIYRIAGHKIPWQIWHGETLVADIEEGDRFYDEETGTTYLTAESIKNFPRNLPGNFPETYKNILYELAWKLREHPIEDTRSETKFYTPEFERIIGGDELNDEQQGKEFKSAILRGVPYLEEQGFDFSECTVSTGLHFLNVKRVGFKAPYHITFRSAKRGLLYLNLGAWKRLGVNNEVLIVVYQGGEMRLFSSKEELLSEKWNEYMLYRVEKPAKIDEDYEGIVLHDKTTHLLFVTSEIMYQSLYQDKLAQRTNKSINAAMLTADEL